MILLLFGRWSMIYVGFLAAKNHLERRKRFDEWTTDSQMVGLWHWIAHIIKLHEIL